MMIGSSKLITNKKKYIDVQIKLFESNVKVN